MRLKLITDGNKRHALVTEQGDIIRDVRSFAINVRTLERPFATIELGHVAVELVPTDEVPRT